MANYPIYRLIKGSTLTFTEMDGNLEWLSRNMSASVVTITGSTFVLGNLNVSDGITGSLFGTSSWAVSASYVLNAVSASYVSGSGAIVTNLTSSNDANINGLIVGRGGGNRSSNTAIGISALSSNAPSGNGTSNVAIGYQASMATITGNINVAIGAYAMSSSIDARSSTIIGGLAGRYIQSSWNVGVGAYALNNQTIGSDNIGIGARVLYENESGSYNTVIGRDSGRGIISGSYNTILGSQLQGLPAGLSNNIIISDGQGNIKYRWDGTQNTISGGLNVTGGPITGSDAVLTGTLTVQTIVAQTITASTEWITGSSKFGSLVTDTHQFTGSLLAPSITGSLFGTSSWAISASWAPSNAPTAVSYIATGSVTASVNTDISASFRVTSGSNTLLNVTRDGFVWIGNGSFTNAGFALDVITGNARINGIQLGIGNGTNTTNTAFGLNAMYLAAVTGVNNVAIGRNALRFLTSGEYNTAIGEGTSANLTDGTRNTVLGGGSGNISSGANNTVLGSFAGTSINGGIGNIFIGYTAGYVLSGVSNVLSINSKTLTAVDEPINAIIYGVQNNTLSNQILRLNARTGVGLSADPIASAQFQIDSTGSGFLPTRTNLTSNISNPAQGLLTYVTASSTEGLWYYSSGSIKGWTRFLNDTGSQFISGSLIATQGFTGSLQGTSSWAVSASWAPGGGGTVTSVTVSAGTGLSGGGTITSAGTITLTNAAPDQTVVLSNGTGINVTGTYPNFTIANTAPDQTVVLSNGTSINVTGTYPNFTITNTAPDQTVTLSNGTGISVTGTYPSFTIASTVTDTNIYNSNGSLSGNRLVTGGGNSLTFEGGSTFIITGSTTNEVLKLSSAQPYLLIQAEGATNAASIFFKPSTSAQNATIQNRSGGGLEFYVGATPSLATTIQSTGRINFTNYTTTTSFTGTVVGFLGFDASGNILTTTGSGATGGASLSGGKTNYNTIWNSTTTVSTGSIFQYSATQIQITGSSLAVGDIAPSSTPGRIDASNDIVSYSTSDIRFKDNIKPIGNALSKVGKISGVYFDWIEDIDHHGNKGHDIGVIAQELEQVLPEVVTTRDSGYKAVKYDKIVALLIQAVKEQQVEINELKSRIDGFTK